MKKACKFNLQAFGILVHPTGIEPVTFSFGN